jgi:hypothetical protein
MSNSLQQKVNDYFHKNKAPKRRSEHLEEPKPHQNYAEIKDKIPEDVRSLIESYKQQHPTMFQVKFLKILKKRFLS